MARLERMELRMNPFRGSLGVAPIGDQMRESQLSLFGNVQRRPITTPVRSETMQVEGARRTGGRPKLTWVVVRRDMVACILMANMALNRAEWQNRSYVADPK